MEAGVYSLQARNSRGGEQKGLCGQEPHRVLLGFRRKVGEQDRKCWQEDPEEGKCSRGRYKSPAEESRAGREVSWETAQ